MSTSNRPYIFKTREGFIVNTDRCEITPRRGVDGDKFLINTGGSCDFVEATQKAVDAIIRKMPAEHWELNRIEHDILHLQNQRRVEMERLFEIAESVPIPLPAEEAMRDIERRKRRNKVTA